MNSAAVVGSGLMGTGIARHLLSGGLNVTLVDTNTAQLSKASNTLDTGNLVATTDLSAIGAAEFIIEAVFEDLSIKQSTLKSISAAASPDAIIASNTSSLLISDLVSAVARPERFLGVHYNNPADMNPIVEIIAIDSTDSAVPLKINQWMSDHGKRAVRCADTPCFVLNRQSLPYINEAARCLSIATAGEIDWVATHKLGAGLGPFAVMNLVGLPVMAAASANLAVLGHGYQAAAALQQQAGSGAWEIDAPPEVARDTISTLIKRLRGAMLFPGKDILDQRLCSRDDLHAICIDALGYEKSSPEMLEVLRPHIVDQLISDYLQQF